MEVENHSRILITSTLYRLQDQSWVEEGNGSVEIQARAPHDHALMSFVKSGEHIPLFVFLIKPESGLTVQEETATWSDTERGSHFALSFPDMSTASYFKSQVNELVHQSTEDDENPSELIEPENALMDIELPTKEKLEECLEIIEAGNENNLIREFLNANLIEDKEVPPQLS